MKIMRKVLSLLSKSEAPQVEAAIQTSLAARQSANKVIDNIYAQIDGSGDKWFLVSKSVVDECKGLKDKGGGN